MASWKIANCKYCGKEFVKKDYRQKYCSQECQGVAAWTKDARCKETLCWRCENTNGNVCPWFSRKGQAVKGWKATPTLVQCHSYNGKKEYAPKRSYIVHECPLFKPDRRWLNWNL